MSQQPTLHLLYSCPFCWKVRGLIEHLGMDVAYVPVNGMKIRKEVAFAGDWGKVPVFTDEAGQHFVDSTPLLRHIDATYNNGLLGTTDDQARQDEWMAWVDTKMSKATVPILYGSLGSALKTTTRISKIEKFGFLSKRLYAWAGFPIMWGFIARKRVKKDGRKPKQLWHDLLTEFTQAHNGQAFFGERDQTSLISQPLATCARSRRSHNLTNSPIMKPAWHGIGGWKLRSPEVKV